ncbi:hypothetical protein [Streptomyces mirabilis]|uniref:hypothetical protein n=1 Tax=Streptomyces mirabilis TaxID=68239 RepID=UPI003810398E
MARNSINQRAIEKHLKEIAKGYERAARRNPIRVPIQTEASAEGGALPGRDTAEGADIGTSHTAPEPHPETPAITASRHTAQQPPCRPNQHTVSQQQDATDRSAPHAATTPDRTTNPQHGVRSSGIAERLTGVALCAAQARMLEM